MKNSLIPLVAPPFIALSLFSSIRRITMRARVGGALVCLFVMVASTNTVVAYTCDTTLVTTETLKQTNQFSRDEVYLADCKVLADESSPFELESGKSAFFTAEQEIQLTPGFHAQAGSHIHQHRRDCIRNPEPNTGYASWGDDEVWMRDTAASFVNSFNGQYGLTVRMKYDEEDADHINVPIADLYKDDLLVTDGRDDDFVPATVWEGANARILPNFGIDQGVFFFHIAHGNNDVWGPNARDGEIDWREQILGNCSSDGAKTGELRYYFLCSCRGLAHGPRVQRSDGAWEYDRPSEYDPLATVGGTADLPDPANVFERLDTVLSANMRMVCGFSTSGRCNVNDATDNVIYYWKQSYFDYLYNVADAWGYANAGSNIRGYLVDASGITVRRIYQTPLCIARGNNNDEDFRSPITDDQVFTEKANPYHHALHIKSWETDSGGITAHDLREPQMLSTAPVFLTERGRPRWFDEESGVLRDEAFLKTSQLLDKFDICQDTFTSKQLTRDGRPSVKVSTHTGNVILSGDRKPISNKDTPLPVEKYTRIAEDFLDKQGWKEQDMGKPRVIRGKLQVKPLGKQEDDQQILAVQSDIALVYGRRIALGNRSATVFGSDNEIVIQMNNDGTIKSASKSWRSIKGKKEYVPVKSYEVAYSEALRELENPGFYKLSSWDLGYKSTTSQQGEEVMAIHYFFSFDPITTIEACTGSPIGISIQGHVLSNAVHEKAR